MDTPLLSNYLNLFSKTSTFVSIDVIGSTALKAGENEQDIVYTFLAYQKLVSQFAYTHHGEVMSITGDGIMGRFERPEDAAHMAKDLLQELNLFNKKQNHLSRPIAIRMGVHTGEVLQSESQASGQLISQTLDLTAKLQQNCPSDCARFSEATMSQLKEIDFPLSKTGWDAVLQMNVYQYSGGSAATVARRALPDPVKVLIVEQELDEILKLKKTLWARQHEAFPVYTQNQAALCAMTWEPHVILLSADLPWDSGWELLQTFRAESRFSSIPIVVMSSVSTGQAIEKAFTKGGNGFLRKPLDEQQILKRVEIALREFYL
jgi:class 3 adenylate cyclase/CheY-like chemotaxis protein